MNQRKTTARANAPRTALAGPVARPERLGRVTVTPGGDARACKRCAHIQADHRKEPCAGCLRDDRHPKWKAQSKAQRIVTARALRLP